MKKTCVDGFPFPAIVHLQKAPVTINSENVPNSALRRKFYHLFKQNNFSIQFWKSTHYLILW